MKEQDTQKLLWFWQIRARVTALLQLSPEKKVRLQLGADDTFYILLFNPKLDCRSIRIILCVSAAGQTFRGDFKVTQSESTISQATFSLQVCPLGVSRSSSRSAQEWAVFLPVPHGDRFALGHEASLGCLEGAKGLRRCREVALSCSLWPKYSMNASGVKLCRWAKECPQRLPSGTLLFVQFKMLAGLPSGQGLG